MYAVPGEKLPEVWKRLNEYGSLYVPASVNGPVGGGEVVFKEWEKGTAVCLDYINTVLPASSLFLPCPASELYLNYRNSGYSPPLGETAGGGEENKKRFVFGVRPCDVKALQLLDPVFEGEAEGNYYLELRKNTTVISLVCKKMGSECFCGSWQINPCKAPGADLEAVFMEEKLYLRVLSEKGEMLVSCLMDLLQVVEYPRLELVEAPGDLRTGVISEKLESKFEDPVWEKWHIRCTNCRRCTAVCPTCYCFSLGSGGVGEKGLYDCCRDTGQEEYLTGEEVLKDSQVAAKERLRNRYLHKLCYHPLAYGKPACTGCGRCFRQCPVKPDMERSVQFFGYDFEV